MGKQAEEVSLPLLDGVNKKDFQQGKIQVEQHIQNATPHQHPDYIGMDISRRNLSEVKKLFEERRKRKPKPRIELLLRKVNSFVRSFLDGYGLPIHKLNGNTIRNAETLTKLPLVPLVNRLLRVRLPGCVLSAKPSYTGRSYILFHKHVKAWGRDETCMAKCQQSKRETRSHSPKSKNPRRPIIAKTLSLTPDSTPLGVQ